LRRAADNAARNVNRYQRKLSATLAMPALARTSSFWPPGAPETPTAPMISLPTLIGTPPPIATTPGIWRSSAPSGGARLHEFERSLAAGALQRCGFAAERGRHTPAGEQTLCRISGLLTGNDEDRRPAIEEVTDVKEWGLSVRSCPLDTSAIVVKLPDFLAFRQVPTGY
jgi:hypothetical protein